MVKIEQLNAAKAVFLRGGIEQPAFLNAILTDAEFQTFKVLEGSVMVSIDESEVKTITAKAGAKAASFSDTVSIQLTTSTDTKSESEGTDTLVTATEEVKIAEKVAPIIVKPASRARK